MRLSLGTKIFIAIGFPLLWLVVSSLIAAFVIPEPVTGFWYWPAYYIWLVIVFWFVSVIAAFGMSEDRTYSRNWFIAMFHCHLFVVEFFLVFIGTAIGIDILKN